MKNKGTLILGVATILVASLFLGAGTFAYFNDTETSSGNIFTAGTLDLEVIDGQNQAIVPFNVGPIAPGDGGTLFEGTIRNVGSIPGNLIICIENIVNHESVGNTEYEQDGDPGELGAYLTVYAAIRGKDRWVTFMGSDRVMNWYGTGKSWDPAGLRLQYAGGPYPTGGLGPLGQNEYYMVYFKYKLGANAPNAIQGDWLTFDIIFRLDQVP